MSASKSLRPLFYLIVINALGAFLISLSYGAADKTVFLLIGSLCALSALSYFFIHLLRLGDGYLFLIVSMLSSIGAIMLLRLKSEYGTKQVIWFVIGVAAYFLTCGVYRRISFWNKLTPVYLAASGLLFIATRLFGTVRNGSRNWIIVGEASVQPSEVIRILLILALSAIFTNGLAPREGQKPLAAFYNTKTGRLCAASAALYMHIAFLVLQREWGLSLLFFGVFLVLLSVYGNDWRFMWGNALLAVTGGLGGYIVMPHIRTRVTAWLNPFGDISGGGYQITQSLFAIGEGGFAGRGIGVGSPYYIPEVHSDFIFSAICEEMGVLGGTAVIMLYFVLVYRGFKIALSCTNPFNKAVALGISAMLGIQTFIIIGGVIKLIPLTGITLPFVSYGGSSMVTTFAALGILQAISAKTGELTDELQ